MLNFILSTEAPCDLSAEQGKEKNINVLPVSYFVEDKEYSSCGDEM